MRCMDKPRSFAPIVAAILLLLPVLYVGSNLALVTPEQNWRSSSGRHTYRVSPRYCAMCYWPLERIDRKLRPETWEEPLQLIFD
jgi:hypothetical protein